MTTTTPYPPVRLAYITKRGAHMVKTISSDEELETELIRLAKARIHAEAWIEPNRYPLVGETRLADTDEGRRWVWSYGRLEVMS
jgi:hypothetical protein